MDAQHGLRHGWLAPPVKAGPVGAKGKMTKSRSDGLFEKWRESAEKFDYFVLGVLGALCAYISQNYEAERVGINSGTFELLALLVLVLAAVFGFRRIEALIQVTLVNHRILHSYERRGVLVTVIQKGPGTNTETGETYTPEYANNEINKVNQQLTLLKPQLEKVQSRAVRFYHLRNALTLIGFLMLLAAKMYSAYHP